jgi:hypothetical protein
MKTLLVFTLLALTNPDSVGMNDPAVNTISVEQVQESVFSIRYMKQNTSVVKVSILNEFGELIFTERINISYFVRPYNLRDLPSGWYEVRIKDGVEEYVERVRAGNEASKPVVQVRKVDPSSLALTVTAKKESDITIEIYDRNNRKLQSVKEDNVRVLGRLLIMKAIEEGYILVRNNGMVVRHDFNLRY